MSNWDMPKMTPENKPNEKGGIFEKLNTKSVGKFVAGATLFTATMGVVGNTKESFGGSIKNDKETIEQFKPNAEKSGLDFFDTSGKTQKSVGGFTVGAPEMPERIINKDTVIQENVGTTNLNGENSREPKEADPKNIRETDERGNTTTRSIGESR